MQITFRPLARTDFGLVARWLAEPLVRRWWNHEFTLEAIERDFGASVDGIEPSLVFVAVDGSGAWSSGTSSPDARSSGTAFGLIQYYLIVDYDEYVDELMAAAVPVAADAGSVDYLIGEQAYLGRGIGTAMVTAFVELLWETQPDLGSLLVPVSTANVASWKALASAGFARQADVDLEPDNPIDGMAHAIMSLLRP